MILRTYNLLICLSFFALTACSVSFSFTGGSTPVEAKNLAIPDVINESPGGPADLGQTVTLQLREYFQRNTKLEVVVDNGYQDLVIEGSITGYRVTPLAPVANGNGGSAAQSELKMTFKGKYFNPHETGAKQEVSFTSTGNAVYNSDQNLTDIESALIEECVEEILTDIYNKTFDTW